MPLFVMPRAHIEGRKGKKAQASTPKPAVESPNTLQSKTTGRIIDVLSEGEIEGLVSGAQSIYLDDTPLQNSDETYNFQGLTWEAKSGTPDQAALSGFPQTENEIDVGAELTKTTSLVRTISESDIDAVRVKVRIPQLTYQDSNGNLRGSSVQFQIEIQANGGAYELATLKNDTNPVTIEGKNTSVYEAQYRVDLPAGGSPWNIKLTRLTDDSTTATLQNKTYWSTYTKIIDAKLSYPDTAMIGIEVDAALFGNELPARSYEIKGIKIQIPSNYNPITRVYTGIWDGTFQTAWSNNPAWVLYDVITNNRYGLGQNISASQVDKFAFYEIAQYCDEMVDDGFGGQEPRFTFNTVINTRREAYDVINTIVSSFRGMAFWASGSVSIAQDKPSDPVKLVTNANVINGDFTYSGTSLKSRHTAALVTWNNPNDGYKPAIAVVEDQDLINRYGWRQADVVAYGSTSNGQAVRFGKWLIDSERYETETVKYKASFDHADLRPGDVISILDRFYAGVRHGGRITAIDERSLETDVTIDSPITLDSDESYTLSMQLPDGTVESLPVLNAPGEASILECSGLFTSLPIVGAVFIVTATSIEPRRFRVISMREEEKNIWEITGLFHDPTKYARVEDGIVLETPSYTAFPTGILGIPGAVGFQEYLYRAGPTIRNALTVSWTPSSDPRVQYYDIQYKAPDDVSYRQLAQVTGTSFDLQDVEPGVYAFKIRSVDGLGGARSAAIEATHEALGLQAPPSQVENFKISILGNTAFLSWDANPDLDLKHYVIRYSQKTDGSATWATSQVLRDDIQSTSVSVPAFSGTFLIKAVDSSGVESEDETVIITTVSLIEAFNTVETITETPTLGGIHVDTENDGGTLKLDETGLPGAEWGNTSGSPTRVMNIAALGAMNNIPGFTFFLVFRTSESNEYMGMFRITEAGGTNPKFQIERGDGTRRLLFKVKQQDSDTIDQGFSSSGAYNLDEFTVLAIKCDMAAGTFVARTNKTQVYSNPFTTTGGNSEAVNAAYVQLGNWFNSGTFDANSDFIHCAFYQSALSDVDLQGFEDELYARYVTANNTAVDATAWGTPYWNFQPDGALGSTTGTNFDVTGGLIDKWWDDTGNGYHATQTSTSRFEYKTDLIGSVEIAMDGYYYFENAVDLGAVYTSRLNVDVDAFGSDTLNNVDRWANVDNIANWDGANPSQWDVKVQARYTSDDPLLTDAEWSEWGDIVVADYTARGFEFRAHLISYQYGITPVIGTLAVTIDMPDRVDGNNDVVCTASGISVTFTPAFNTTPAIAISAEDMAIDDRYTITNKSATGFDIEFFNAGGTSITKTFDWVVKGFGRQQ